MSTGTAFVTGATGFIGQHLVRELIERGWRVRVLVRPSSQTSTAAQLLRYLGAQPVIGDILDKHALQQGLDRSQVLVHLAGNLLRPGVAEQHYRRVHIEGTRKLLELGAEHALERCVYVSTTGVLGPTGPYPRDEDSPRRPVNIYEQTKAQAEQLSVDIANRTGLALVIARPALVYGPGDLHLLGWFRAIKRGLYRVIGDGQTLLHPIYIADLIKGLLDCAELPQARGRIYHLVGERPLQIVELAAAIAHALGTRLPQQRIPLQLAYLGAQLLEQIPGVDPAKLPLSRQRVTFMTQSRAYCGCRAREELGFVADTSLHDGLRTTVRWYRERGLV